MAEFPNRAEHRAPLARDLAKLTAKQRRRLFELMGTPPDPLKVPESFWTECQKELEDELAAAILLLFLTSATMHGLDYETAEQAGSTWASGRAEHSAESIVATTRERIRNADRRSPTHQGAVHSGAVEGITDAEQTANVRDAVNRALGPDRAAAIASHEANVAMVEGGEAAINLLGIVCEAFWTHTGEAPPHHAGAEVDPCPTCTPYLGKERAECDGKSPGLCHFRCDCFWTYIETHSGNLVGTKSRKRNDNHDERGRFASGSGNLETTDSAGRKYTFIPHPNQRADETTIMVDASKLDAAWKTGAGSLYIDQGGGGTSTIIGRREGVERFLESGKPIEASRIVVDQNGTVDFIDGRHRFSVLRDRGVKEMAVTLSKDDVVRAEHFLGAKKVVPIERKRAA